MDDTVGDAPACVGDAVDDVGEVVEGIGVRALLTELVTPTR